MVPYDKSIKISNISDATSDDHCLALMLWQDRVRDNSDTAMALCGGGEGGGNR